MLDDPIVQKYNLLVPGIPGSSGKEAAIMFKLAAQLRPPVSFRRCSSPFPPFYSIPTGADIISRKQPHPVRQRHIVNWNVFTKTCQPLARQQPAQDHGRYSSAHTREEQARLFTRARTDRQPHQGQ